MSFDLYLTAKKAQIESEAIAEQWSREAADYFSLTREISFTYFLQAWYEGRDNEAESIAKFLSDGSKERKTADFFLNPSLSAGKEAGLRQTLSNEPSWFVDFVVGEYHLKNDNKEEAIRAYSDSHESIKRLSGTNQASVDAWLVTRVIGRLYELSAADQAGKDLLSTECGEKER